MDYAFNIHEKGLQILITDMYRARNDLYTLFLQGVFCENTDH